MPQESEYPMRINKYLAMKNICSRREADRLLEEGAVRINGRKAKLGEKVQETDEVSVNEEIKNKKVLVYLAFHKPRSVVTHSPQKGEKSIEDIIMTTEKVFPLGRLDKDSRGLIILTNDGRLTDKLLNPDYEHEKEYVVEVDREMSPSFLKHMAEGVELDDGYRTKPCKVKRIDSLTFSIILTEGKKRQIRRMSEKLGRHVVDLRRIRIMNIHLNDLKPGRYRKIRGAERQEFFSQVGLFDKETG